MLIFGQLHEADHQLGIDGRKRLGDASTRLLDRSRERRHARASTPQDRLGVARDRVGPPTADAVGQAHAFEIDVLVGEHADEHGDRIGATFVDVDAAVTTVETLDPQAHGHVAVVMGFTIQIPRGVQLTTSSARQIDATVELGVEVDHAPRRQQRGIELKRPAAALLFVGRVQQLERRVNEPGRERERETGCDADAVVGSERGADRLQDVALAPLDHALGSTQRDRIAKKIMRTVAELLADHVHVALDRERLAPDSGPATGHAQHDVACVVGLRDPALAVCQRLQVRSNACFVQ